MSEVGPSPGAGPGLRRGHSRSTPMPLPDPHSRWYPPPGLRGASVTVTVAVTVAPTAETHDRRRNNPHRLDAYRCAPELHRRVGRGVALLPRDEADLRSQMVRASRSTGSRPSGASWRRLSSRTAFRRCSPSSSEVRRPRARESLGRDRGA
jgi:hypothetical protein